MPRNELLEQMIDALQIIVVLARRLDHQTSADMANIRAATDRVVDIVKQLREGAL